MESGRRVRSAWTMEQLGALAPIQLWTLGLWRCPHRRGCRYNLCKPSSLGAAVRQQVLGSRNQGKADRRRRMALR